MCQFPVACSDGLLDVVVVKSIGKIAALQLMDGADIGEHTYNHPSVEYYKVACLRVTPAPVQSETERKRWVAIDGEPVPLEPFQVEGAPVLSGVLLTFAVHRGLAHVIGREWTLPQQWKAPKA